MKSNIHKKHYRCDKWGWTFYCPGAALRRKRTDKHKAKRKTRHIINNNLRKEISNESNLQV